MDGNSSSNDGNGRGRGHRDAVLPFPGNTVFPVSQLAAHLRYHRPPLVCHRQPARFREAAGNAAAHGTGQRAAAGNEATAAGLQRRGGEEGEEERQSKRGSGSGVRQRAMARQGKARESEKVAEPSTMHPVSGRIGYAQWMRFDRQGR